LLIKTNPLIAMQRGFRQHFRSHFAPCSKYCVTVGIKMAPCKTSQESELRRLRTVGTPEPCVSGGRPSCSVADTPWPLTHTWRMLAKCYVVSCSLSHSEGTSQNNPVNGIRYIMCSFVNNSSTGWWIIWRSLSINYVRWNQFTYLTSRDQNTFSVLGAKQRPTNFTNASA
jgi:hypothetical protein